MAQNFIKVDSLNYCGKEANEIFSKMIYDLDLANSGITLRDNVKGKEKLYTGKVGDVWQSYTCPFTPSGEASLAESFIEPARIKINLENCYDSFDSTYFVEQTKIALDGGIPQTFSDWFFNEQLLPKMKKEYQEIFWRGDTTYSQETKKYLKVTDGIEKKLNNADGVKKINGTAFTVDNVLSQVEAAVIAAINNANDLDVDTEDYVIFMNHSDVRLLEMALGKQSAQILTTSVFSNFYRQGEDIYVLGYKVVRTMQSRNSIIVGPVRNIVLGYDTFDSHTEYKLIDMRETTGDNMFRVLALSNIAVGLVLPELFVYSRVNG